LDKNDDGRLTYEELKTGLRPKNMKKEENYGLSYSTAKKNLNQSYKMSTPSRERENSSQKKSAQITRDEKLIDNKYLNYAIYPYEPVRKPYSPFRDTVQKE
jgi:hypothetical protein